MKKKRSTKLINAGDILLTTVCLLGMAVALYLFWTDLNLSLSKQNDKPIAVVYFKQNTVQRRFVDRNLWERVQKSAPVYDGDRIRTADLSEAVAVFADGTEIEIHENTLIQIYMQKNKAAIDFQSGAITATVADAASGRAEGGRQETALVIKTGSRVLELDSGAVASIAGSPAKENGAETQTAGLSATDVAVTVTKGTAYIREARTSDAYQGETSLDTTLEALTRSSLSELETTARDIVASVSGPVQDAADYQAILAGDAVFVSASENELSETVIRAEKNVVFLPQSSTTLYRSHEKSPSLKMRWESEKPVVVEFSDDASFDTILFSTTYAGAENNAEIPLDRYQDHEQLFWRVRHADTAAAEIASGTVFLEDEPEEAVQDVIDRVLDPESEVPLKEETTTEEEAVKAAAVERAAEERRRLEEERAAEAARLEAERLAEEEARVAEEARLEAERVAAEQAAAEEAARIEAVRVAAEEAARVAEQQRLEAERVAAEQARIAEEKRAAARAAEQQKLAEQQRAAEAARAAEAKKAAEAKAAEEQRIAAEKAAEEQRIAAEKAAAERAEAARAAEAARIAEEKRAAEAAREAEQQKLAEERAAAEALAASRRAFASSCPKLRGPDDGKLFDDEYFDSNNSIVFSWALLDDADSYELVIQKKGALFGTVLSRTVNNTQYSFRDLEDLEEGEFEWTLTGLMKDGTRSETATGSFSVKTEPLGKVTIDTGSLFRR